MPNPSIGASPATAVAMASDHDAGRRLPSSSRTRGVAIRTRRRAAISSKAGEGKLLPTLGYGLILLWTLGRALVKERSVWSVGRIYLRYFFRVNLKYRRDAVGFAQFMNRCVTHWHFYKFTRLAIAGKLRLFGTT